MIISRLQTRLYLRLSIAVAILGILFKLMHWPYPWILLVSGTLGISIFYSLRFSVKHPKTLLDYSKLFLLIAFLFHYIFRVFHLAYGYVFTTLTQFAFVLFLILYVRDVLFLKEYNDDDHPNESSKNSFQKGLSYLLYGTAAIGIIIGAQFKILHWEFGFITGNVLLTIGLLAAAVAVVLGLKDTEA